MSFTQIVSILVHLTEISDQFLMPLISSHILTKYIVSAALFWSLFPPGIGGNSQYSRCVSLPGPPISLHCRFLNHDIVAPLDLQYRDHFTTQKLLSSDAHDATALTSSPPYRKGTNSFSFAPPFANRKRNLTYLE